MSNKNPPKFDDMAKDAEPIAGAYNILMSRDDAFSPSS